MNDKDVIGVCDVKSLSHDDKRNALNLITMIKEKRDGKIKGRACADEYKQCRYIAKDEVSSPTIQMESLMVTLLLDAYKNRDVATTDVAGAYLLVDMDEYILVKVTGASTALMFSINPDYSKYVTNEKGKKTLYLRLAKALYGCMQSALLWYKAFKEGLEKIGFTVNPYDPCVANKMVNNEHCTICWYVDDTKISHKDSKVVDWVLKELESKFGKMSVSRGK